MLTARLLGLISFFFISLPAYALELFTWSPDQGHPPFIIGVRDGESPEAAARRYLNGLAADPMLNQLTAGKADVPLVSFAPLTKGDPSQRTLLIMNSPRDFKPGALVLSFAEPVNKNGGQAYIVPLAADVGLSEAESKEFVRLTNQSFEHFIPMGGDDIDPRIYNEPNTHAKNVNARRDLFEVKLVREKIKSIRAEIGTHRITAVCRGSQLTAALLGYKIEQDIPTHVPGHIDHSRNASHEGGSEPSHEVRLLDTTIPFLKSWLKQTKIMVNTYHHQFVKFVPGGELELAAVAPDGIPEAMISKNGRIRLMQFHPEALASRSQGFMRWMGQKILEESSKPVHRSMHGGSCRAVFN